MADDLTRLMERVNRVTAERDDARAEATDLRARVASSEAERARLAKLADDMADAILSFLGSSVLNQRIVDRLRATRSEYRAARSAGAGDGAGVEVEG